MTIHGSTRECQRAVQKLPQGHRSRRRCCFVNGCQNKCTHYGVVIASNGQPMAMTTRCQFHVHAWVRDGR